MTTPRTYSAEAPPTDEELRAEHQAALEQQRRLYAATKARQAHDEAQHTAEMLASEQVAEQLAGMQRQLRGAHGRPA